MVKLIKIRKRISKINIITFLVFFSKPGSYFILQCNLTDCDRRLQMSSVASYWHVLSRLWFCSFISIYNLTSSQATSPNYCWVGDITYSLFFFNIHTNSTNSKNSTNTGSKRQEDIAEAAGDVLPFSSRNFPICSQFTSPSNNPASWSLKADCTFKVDLNLL